MHRVQSSKSLEQYSEIKNKSLSFQIHCKTIH